MTDGGTGASAAAGWLRPEEFSARYEADAARLCVRVARGDEIADVRAAMAFPITAPGEYIDFTADGKPLGMLRSLAGLDAESRAAVESALGARYLVPQVRRVLEIVEISPFVFRWRVETDRGERTFCTESPRESVRYQAADHIRITDLAGGCYDIPALSALDAGSRAALGFIL